MTSGMDLALALVEEDLGSKVALAVAPANSFSFLGGPEASPSLAGC